MLEILAHNLCTFRSYQTAKTRKIWNVEKILLFQSSHILRMRHIMQRNNKYLEFLLCLIFIQTNECKSRIVCTLDKEQFFVEIFGGGGGLYADLYFFFQFSQFLSMRYCIIMNWARDLIPGVKLWIVRFYIIFFSTFLLFNQSWYLVLTIARERHRGTGAKCFVLNRGIEVTRCDGMLGLLLPTVLCMALHIKEMHIAVI